MSGLSDESAAPTNLMTNCPNSNQNLQLPSPIMTKRTKTIPTSARALENPIEMSIVTAFSRGKGHGFITLHSGGEAIFVNIDDIEGEYVPMPGEGVKYRLVCHSTEI